MFALVSDSDLSLLNDEVNIGTPSGDLIIRPQKSVFIETKVSA